MSTNKLPEYKDLPKSFYSDTVGVICKTCTKVNKRGVEYGTVVRYIKVDGKFVEELDE